MACQVAISPLVISPSLGQSLTDKKTVRIPNGKTRTWSRRHLAVVSDTHYGSGDRLKEDRWSCGKGSNFLSNKKSLPSRLQNRPCFSLSSSLSSSSSFCSTPNHGHPRGSVRRSHWSPCASLSHMESRFEGEGENTGLPLGSPTGSLLRFSSPSVSGSFGNTREAKKSRDRFLLRAARDPTEPHASSPSGALSVGEGLEILERGMKTPPLGSVDISEEEGGVEEMESLEEFLETSLPSHPKLHRGMLDNGLRYVILPNKVPPNRFEAHLEMHVGSVDEGENEQGVAHMIEHVTFLGSKKREKLLGTGARSNAYTDFHHTVFHVHAPVTAQGKDEPLLPLVLEALHEIAFKPQFLPTRIEKERRAVLSELQMMNTIEYRVDCQLLQQLHSENLLSQRFPIGLEEQIKQWDPETIRAFHERWYFPANATLYIVGDIGSVQRTVQMIEAQFGPQPAGFHYPTPPTSQSGPASSQNSNPLSATDSTPFSPPPTPSSPLPRFTFSLRPNVVPPSPTPSTTPPPQKSLHRFNPFFQPPMAATVSPFPSPSSTPQGLQSSSSPTVPPVKKERHKIRPPVEHRWSTQNLKESRNGYSAKSEEESVPHVFQHELLQNFSMSIFCKTPVRSVQRYKDLRAVLMQRIVLSAFQFRITNRYKSGSPPFLSVELDHSDSGREGCTVSTLTVNAEPRNWRGAIKVAMQEVRRLKEFGVTQGELTRYLGALVKDAEQLAAMVEAVPSLDNLDFAMESDALRHTVMDQEQGHECLREVAGTVTLEDVNAVGSSLLEYVADFGKPSAPIPAAIVACVPTFIHSLSGGKDERFEIDLDNIRSVIMEGLQEPIAPEPEVDVPKSLLSPFDLATLKFRARPSFVSVDPNGTGSVRLYDEATGIIQRRLSNGICVNMKITQNEAKGGVLRMVAPGGRALEDPQNGGAVVVGVRTLSEGGTVGNFSREQVELFCVSKLINCVLEADEEFLCMDFHFTLRDGGLQATFQLLHMVLQHSVWQSEALSRAQALYSAHYRGIWKSLERATAHRLMRAMFPLDERLMDPRPGGVEGFELEGLREAVMSQLKSGALEVSLVGDFSEEEVERCLLDFLGTVSMPKTTKSQIFDFLNKAPPVKIVTNPPPELLHQRVALRDTDERARAYLAGGAPNRWGKTQDGRDLNVIVDPVPQSLSEEQAKMLAPLGVEVVEGEDGKKCWQRRRHPLYASVSLALLAEIINARLFTTVRDALGLTYDVSFEVSLLDRLELGWFVVSVTSTPAKIDQAVEASLNVIRGLHGNRVNQRELDRAKRTLLMRHESDLKDNAYWLGLITHLQSSTVPQKDVGCIQDLPYLYEVATADDIYNAYNYLSLDQDSVFTCVGVAGAEKGEEGVETVEEVGGETEESEAGGMLPLQGRGMSTMTRPTM